MVSEAIIISQTRLLDITDWLSWFLGCTGRAIEASEKILQTITAKADFWRRNAHVSLTLRQRKAINRPLDAGKGCFEGGLTTRKYVSLTNANRATAYREITDLVERGSFSRAGGWEET